MAGKSNIKISVTTDEKGAVSGLKNLDDQVGKTGGGLGNLGKAAAVGGAALVAVGIKSVMAFEDLGLTVGKFADATGTTNEQASRLIEIGDDLGISSETLSSSIGKMSKQLGTNADAFKAYGIEVVKGKDGQTDVNATFLAAVDAINGIQDPLKKAEASAKVFGKGYQQMSELLGESSSKIRADLAAVSDQKVFDDKKVQQARDMREAFDSIVDAGQDLLLTIGSALAPVITKLAPTLTKVVEAAGPLAESIGTVLASALEAIGPIIEGLLPVIETLAKALAAVGTAIAWATGPHSEAATGLLSFNDRLTELKDKADAAGISADDFQKMFDAAGKEIKSTGDMTFDMNAQLGVLDGKLLNATDRTDSWSDSARIMFERSGHVKTGLEDVAGAADTTTVAVDQFTQKVQAADAAYQHLIGKLDEEDAWQHVQESMFAFAATVDPTAEDVRNLTRDVAEYINNTKLIPESKKTKYLAELDAGQVALVEQQLAALARNRTVSLDIVAKGGAGYSKLPQFASGGVVPGPKGTPTLAVVHGGETVVPNGGVVGGLTVQVFAAGHIATERDIVRSIVDGIIDAQARGEIPAGAFN